jgi:hypothetical protein
MNEMKEERCLTDEISQSSAAVNANHLLRPPTQLIDALADAVLEVLAEEGPNP